MIFVDVDAAIRLLGCNRCATECQYESGRSQELTILHLPFSLQAAVEVRVFEMHYD